MKRVGVAMICCLIAASFALAHNPGEDMTSVSLGKGKVTIEYGTPKLGSRNLDDMIKPGLAWRMGMNSPTTLETTIPLDFGSGKNLPPGKYTIFARPDEKKNWTLLVASGSLEMFTASKLVVASPLQFTKDTASQDLLKIRLEKTSTGASLSIAWGTYRLRGMFKAAA